MQSVMNEEMEKVKGVPGGQERALHREAENSADIVNPKTCSLVQPTGGLCRPTTRVSVAYTPAQILQAILTIHASPHLHQHAEIHIFPDAP